MTKIGQEKTYSMDGPECPSCGFTITPDEGSYYDENRYTQDECPECGTKFKVEVYHSTSWTCHLTSPLHVPPSAKEKT